ncbi:hypothetical protein [Saccharopolyspora pogona]|uniref:hypothetical protein n=1 Tax=Saccharopolyspora pogona TaxID=333966 RepID=UPI0037C5CB88
MSGFRRYSTEKHARATSKPGQLDVAPRFVAIAESGRPVIQLPLLDTLVHAPTAAVLPQFREVVLQALRGHPGGRPGQPVFAWR